MGADAEADEGLLAQAKDNDKISGYLGRWKAYLPLSTDGIFYSAASARRNCR